MSHYYEKCDMPFISTNHAPFIVSNKPKIDELNARLRKICVQTVYRFKSRRSPHIYFDNSVYCIELSCLKLGSE